MRADGRLGRPESLDEHRVVVVQDGRAEGGPDARGDVVGTGGQGQVSAFARQLLVVVGVGQGVVRASGYESDTRSGRPPTPSDRCRPPRRPFGARSTFVAGAARRRLEAVAACLHQLAAHVADDASSHLGGPTLDVAGRWSSGRESRRRRAGPPSPRGPSRVSAPPPALPSPSMTAVGASGSRSAIRTRPPVHELHGPELDRHAARIDARPRRVARSRAPGTQGATRSRSSSSSICPVGWRRRW